MSNLYILLLYVLGTLGSVLCARVAAHDGSPFCADVDVLCALFFAICIGLELARLSDRRP